MRVQQWMNNKITQKEIIGIKSKSHYQSDVKFHLGYRLLFEHLSCSISETERENYVCGSKGHMG